MNIKEIHDAAMNGRTFRFTGKIEQFSFENGKLKIDWVFPDAGKPFNSNHDFAYIELAPKYDPCRPFKVGDEVRYCAPDGRIYADRGSLIEHIKNRDFTRVIRDELPNGRVGVFDPFDEENPYYVPAHALELVTPVEEKEPFNIYKSDDNEYVITFEDSRVSTFPFKGDGHPYYYTQEQAKARAEQERDRLNDEWRKEQRNG